LKFINKTFPSYDKNGNFKISPAPFPSQLIFFIKNELSELQINKLNKYGKLIKL